ncbi:two-partner secretion domain-containing protein, partial [Cupriavidus pinatubonensis]|uniref:two-partner secretion domain-containing protein n=1 Tax=Cupriavidus pinatubonensis TaxID=248026 RepID=UPI00112C1F2F
MTRKQSAATAPAAQNRTAAQIGTLQGDATSDMAPGVSMAERTRRSVAGRALAGLVAVTLWLAPLQVSLQQARQAAGVLAAGAVAVDAPAVLAGAMRQGLLRWAVNHLPVAVSFGVREANAAPIVDPTAPIRFQPTISATTGPGAPEGGVPVVGITTPNAAGISLNQYRAFVVDPVGLILNNSTTGGGTFLGGQVAANPNLSGSGPANLIINQVTSSAAAQINGTVEVFGGPAALVIAAPGGVYTSGAGFTNATQVTLTTGVPQFLSTTGAPSSFDAAATAGFLVEGGRIQIANPAPGNPNGVGIEGTVGNVNLIAESIGIDAALYAGNHINVVAGRQLVAPAGTGFATTATGPNNASTNTTAANGLAIDATAFGAMTAGQISILSTAAGVGVRADGNLAASAGNLTLDSAGNLKVGKTYGKGDVALNAAGNIDAAGNGQSEGNYSVRAGRDATLGGTLSANQAVTVSAGGSINGAGSVTAQQAAILAAGGSVDVGGAVSGSQVTVTAAGNDGKGDIHLGGDVTSPGLITLGAARDTTIDGNVVSAGDLNLTTQRNMTVHGAAASVSGNVSLTGVTGSVTTTGDVVSPGSLTVNAGTDANLGGQVTATGPINVTAQTGSISTSGQVSSNDNLTLTAAQNVTVGGEAQSAGNTTITATGGSATVNGALSANGDATIKAAQDATVTGSVGSGGNTTVQATNGSATVTGGLLSFGNATISGGQNTTLGGGVLTVGDLNASAGQNLTVGALPYVGGNATLRGKDIALGSAAIQDNVVAGALDAAATNSVALIGNTQATNVTLAAPTLVNAGTTVAKQTLSASGGTLGNLGTLAGNQVSVDMADVVNRGTLGGQTVNLTASNTLDNTGGLIVGVQTLNVTTGALISNAGGTLFAGDLTGQSPPTGDLTLTVTGGNSSFNNAAGQVLAGNNATVNLPNQAIDLSAATTGTISANNTVTLAAQSIDNIGTWTTPGAANTVLNGAQGISNTGTLQGAGNLTLTTGGTLDNQGNIVGGSSLTMSGSTVGNSGTIHADGDLALAGNVVNSGTVEALSNLNITGGDYDNRGGTTQAGKNLAIDIGGTLNNTASVIGAVGDVHIAAQQVINDRGTPVDAGSVSGQVINDALVNSTVIGSHATAETNCYGDAGCNTTMTGPPVNLTLGDLIRNSDGTIPLLLGNVEVPTGDLNGSSQWVLMWHLGMNPTWYPDLTADWQQIVPLSAVTVDRKVMQQTEGVAGQITSGGKLDMTAASLSNKGGVISAAGDATLNVGALDNGHSASLLDGVTDTVNQASLSAFLTQLQAIGGTSMGGLAAPGNVLMYGPLTIPQCSGGDNGCSIPTAVDTPFVIGKAADGSTVTGLVQTSVTERVGKAGQIIVGGNLALNGTGNLTNAGDLAAAGNITITTPGTFTNQGFYDAKVTTTPGCMPGSTTCANPNPHVDDLTWQQQNNTVAAGGTLTVQAASVQNLNGTLAARGNVSVTAGISVVNQSGTIQSVNGDVSITAPTLVNKAMDPVTLHKDYGNLNPSYAGGCNAGGSYKGSNCSADETVAAGPAGIIQGARNVALSGTTLANNGGMISGGNNVTVNMTGAVDNTSLLQNANWAGMWVEKTGMFSSDKHHSTNGVTVLGSQESLIQAGNVLSVTAGGQVQNTGNLMGQQVDVSGATLLNGYTSPNQPTPPSTVPKQVISLGPPPVPAGSLPSGTPATDPTQPWQFNPVIVTTPATPTTGGPQTIDWHFTANLGGNPLNAPGANTDRAQYLNQSPATAVLAGVTPDYLLSQLPADLKPGSVTFYYDPYTESQKLDQAALQQTGHNSFINGLAYDSQNQLSVQDQEKLALYQNAADYAKANNIHLGTALTPAQIAALDKPMLWYVEQAVPDPSCNTVSSAVCPGVTALVPQVYLPEGYAQATAKSTGGTIVGNDVSLDIAGQIRNSGAVMAADKLVVRAGTIDNDPNVVNIGKSAYGVQGGWMEYTGTQVQPGGFMSAANLDLQAGSINAVNDAFRITNPDGTTNQAATEAFIAQLSASLGEQYTASTVTDDIHQNFIKKESALPSWAIMAAAVVIAIVTYGAASYAIGAAAAAEAGAAGAAAAGTAAAGAAEAAAVGGTWAAATATASAGLGNVMASAALAGMASSAVSQGLSGQGINFGKVLEAGAVGAITAGLTNGITVDSTGSLGFNTGVNVAGSGTQSLASLAGVSNSSGVMQAAKDGATGALWQQGAAILGTGLITAGVGNAFYGGSFGNALTTNLITQGAALGAYAIGEDIPGIGDNRATADTQIANVLVHAALGCASSAALGTGCAGGAIGGATSAVVAGSLVDQA